MTNPESFENTNNNEEDPLVRDEKTGLVMRKSEYDDSQEHRIGEQE